MATTPAHRAQAAREQLGAVPFAEWCAAVLRGRTTLAEGSDPDPRWLAGPAWTAWGAPDTWAARELDHWPRVWAARSLLHEWQPIAEGAVVTGLSDPAWRVREMCAKVVAAHEVTTAVERCVAATVDEVPRVRAAAVRALGVIGEGEHAVAVAALLSDPDPAVRTAAERAAVRMEERLDRSFADLAVQDD